MVLTSHSTRGDSPLVTVDASTSEGLPLTSHFLIVHSTGGIASEPSSAQRVLTAQPLTVTPPVVT